CMQSIDFPFTF
nr:immunoglobulin light chain junction region [Macaca mulatta]